MKKTPSKVPNGQNSLDGNQKGLRERATVPTEVELLGEIGKDPVSRTVKINGSYGHRVREGQKHDLGGKQGRGQKELMITKKNRKPGQNPRKSATAGRECFPRPYNYGTAVRSGGEDGQPL